MTNRNDESAVTEAAEKTQGDAPEQGEKEPLQKETKKKGLQERLKAAEAKAEENYDRLLRVTAEFENYKKRMEREMNEYRKFANEALIKDILPIVDNLERALEIPYGNNEKASHGMREGVEMTLKGLLSSLEKFGAVPIESLGKPFDPNFHQAVMQEESEEHPENTVVQELQKGFMMRDRLLRPAMVVVSKKSDAKSGVKAEGSGDEHKIDITIQ
ncbi:MAG: nucleotide exchange factor GrpE [Deltaproteobacteria bacterium]|nr:nucleotide exchange factor GrpE [Deltaproteobacteria bacterium]MBW2019286.1 nucleotide exchange factor GrpE [Deltaproteobacteria bacterium]MBW2074093.1 nucleotide exchange factor GrpE [Deltaproteobacteria bacterium]RLB82579.1 MAG: nucleotide exchange factor GrpE [Deltaproteobacteria bacterium]